MPTVSLFFFFFIYHPYLFPPFFLPSSSPTNTTSSTTIPSRTLSLSLLVAKPLAYYRKTERPSVDLDIILSRIVLPFSSSSSTCVSPSQLPRSASLTVKTSRHILRQTGTLSLRHSLNRNTRLGKSPVVLSVLVFFVCVCVSRSSYPPCIPRFHICSAVPGHSLETTVITIIDDFTRSPSSSPISSRRANTRRHQKIPLGGFIIPSSLGITPSAHLRQTSVWCQATTPLALH